MIEIERRFLVNPVLFYNYKEKNEYKVYLIEQTYYENPFFRIRAKERLLTQNSEIKYYFTIKIGTGIERNELEEQISQNIGSYLLRSKKNIQKHRFVMHDNWEIDHFLNPKLCELWIAEKELEDINEQIILPDYITMEITEKEEYSNYNLWKKL